MIDSFNFETVFLIIVSEMYDFVYFHTFFSLVLLSSSFWYIIRYIICMKTDELRGSNDQRKERAAFKDEGRN